jgi:hypothetical protein
MLIRLAVRAGTAIGDLPIGLLGISLTRETGASLIYRF